MKKLLILAAPYKYYKGGSEYQYQLIEKELNNYFDIKYLFRYSKPLNNEKYITYNYNFRKKYNRYNYSDTVKIYNLIKTFSPDIIYKRGLNYITAIGVYYAKKFNKKIIIHIASKRDLERFKIRSSKYIINEFIDKKLIYYSIKNATKIICQTNQQAKNLKKNFNINCDRVLPNFHPYPEEKIEKKHPIKVVWVANFKTIKQPAVFINLANEFINRNNVKFIMIGKSAYNEWQNKLEKKINRLNNLDYKGELDNYEVNNILASSHIFINTSKYEGFPNTFIQSMLRQMPILSLNINPDNILHDNGIGFCTGSFENLVNKLNYLLENEDIMNAMGKKAYNFAIAKYSLKNIETLHKLFIE